jgi:hypothetical protein
MADACDALIIAHYIADTLRSVFGNVDDRAYITLMTPTAKKEEERSTNGSTFVELFVTTHQLREYLERGNTPEFYGKFQIVKDQDGGVLWSGDHLETAIQQLLTMDANHSIRGAWHQFFSHEIGVL